MTYVLAKERIGGLEMTLRESAASNYSLIYQAVCDPVNVGVTHLGTNRNAAMNIFIRKVDMHRSLVERHRAVDPTIILEV
jgi:hypothetical protein